MKTLAINSKSRQTSSGLDRYARTQTTVLSYSALKQMRLIVAGAGALGNEVVKNLGLLGAGSVMIVDPDRIELSNLSRSIFFRADDCGHPKAETLCRALATIFSDTRWEFRNCEIADVGLGELAGADLILTCLDTDLARLETAWMALRLDIPVADAGLGGTAYWHGRVSFFPGRSSACFCCKLSPRRRAQLFALALSTGHSCWAETGSQLPSTPTMAAMIGALQVDFGLRCLTRFRNGDAKDCKSSTIEIALDSDAKLRRFATSVSPGCPFHQAFAELSFPLEHPRTSARELLDSHGMQVVDLDWPLCTRARCLDCGSDWKPMKRVAWMRRHGACPLCQGHKILEEQTISSLDRESPWADTPLIELGLPKHHLYALRSMPKEESQ